MTKVAAITGGAQGIGRACAMLFSRKGYRVAILDPHREAGFEVIRAIRQQGGDALYIAGDVANEADVEKWFQVTESELGPVEVLINNAGISPFKPMFELTAAEFDRVLSVNLRGTFLCSKRAAISMRRTGKGSIINIASTRALMSEPDGEAYAASKGGILALTHAMAVSLGPYGIRVNAISPGWIETGPWKYSKEAVMPVHSDADRLQHPVGRVGIPEDIAEASLFLAGEASSFITGQNLVIDGGMTIKMIYV